MAETLLTNSEWYVLDCLWERAPHGHEGRRDQCQALRRPRRGLLRHRQVDEGRHLIGCKLYAKNYSYGMTTNYEIYAEPVTVICSL